MNGKEALKTAKGLRGQASIIVVLAIMILFAVVIIFTWQAFIPQEPSEIGELKRLLRDRVEERIYTGAFETLERIGSQAGHLDLPSPSIAFGKEEVPYWQMCQNGFIPPLEDVVLNIEEGLKRYLNSWEIEEFEGKKVIKTELNTSDIEVVLSPNRALFRVWMHITLEGYKLTLPLEIEMESSFLTLYNFARDFTQENLEERHLETFIGSIFFHSYEDTDHISSPNFLPNIGILTDCGQTIYKTWDELERVISGMVSYSLTHINFWQSPPPEQDRTFLNYYIPDLNGNTYPQYQIDFLPMGNLTQDSLQPSQSPVVITNNKVAYSFVPICRKEYDVRYSWYQPLVVKLTDAVNYSFRFGVLPYIYQSAIGSCSVEMKWNHTENPCEIGNCHARIRVLDTEGSPIEGARASLGACQIGKKTDSQGILEGSIPCGIGELNLYHKDYIYHYDIVGSDEIKDKTVTLTRMPLLITNFYKYLVSYEKPVHHYSDPFSGYSPGFEGLDCLQDMLCCNYQLEREPASGYNIIVNFKRKDPLPWELEEIYIGNINPENQTVSDRNINYLPPALYSTSSDLIDPEKKGMTGLMEGEYELREEPLTRDMHISTPSYSFLPTFGFEDPEYSYYRERLLRVMSDCGIDHVTEDTPPQQCYLYTWCSRDERTGALQDCDSGNKDLVLDPLLQECGQSPSGTLNEKVERLEDACGKRVIFKTLSETEGTCR